MAVNIDSVIDAAIFEAVDSTGFEDAGRDSSGAIEPDGKTKDQFIDAPIPVVIRYGVGDKDGSEKAKLVLEIETASVGSGDSGLKFVYSDSNDEGKFKSIPNDKIGVSTVGENTIFTFSNIASTNDPIIKGLHLIPQANHVPSGGIDITAKIFVSDTGIDFTEQSSKPINVKIIDRADAFPVSLQRHH